MATAANTTPPNQRPRRRAVVSDVMRKLIKDRMDEAASSILADPVMMGGGDDGDSPDSGETGGATHVHVHMHSGSAGGGEGGGAGAPGTELPGSEVPGDIVPPVEGADDAGGELTARVAALETGVAEILTLLKGGKGGGETPPEPKPTPAAAADEFPPADETEDPKGKEGNLTGDSAALETGFKAVMADAEILVPGFQLPTFDSKVERKITIDSMCATRRKVLDTLYATEDGKALVNGVTGVTTLDTKPMTCVDVANLYRSSAVVKRALNNRASTGDGKPPVVPAVKVYKVPTLAELNALHRKTYEH